MRLLEHIKDRGLTIQALATYVNKSFGGERVIEAGNIHALLAGNELATDDHVSILRRYLRELPRVHIEVQSPSDREALALRMLAYKQRMNISDNLLAEKMSQTLPGRPDISYKTVERFLESVSPPKKRKFKPEGSEIPMPPPRTRDDTVSLFRAFMDIIDAERILKRDGLSQVFGEQLAAAFSAIPFKTDASFELATYQSKGWCTTVEGRLFCAITEEVRYEASGDLVIYDGVLIRTKAAYMAVMRDRIYFQPRSFALTQHNARSNELIGDGYAIPYLGAAETFRVKARVL